MAFLAWANMVFDQFDFGNSFSYIRNSPIIFANWNYTSFAPSLCREEQVIHTGTCLCFLHCWPCHWGATRPLLTYSSVSSESLVPGTCWLVPRWGLAARGKSKGTNGEAPVPSSLLSTGTAIIFIQSKAWSYKPAQSKLSLSTNEPIIMCPSVFIDRNLMWN